MQKIIINTNDKRGECINEALKHLFHNDNIIEHFNIIYNQLKDYPNSYDYKQLEEQYNNIMYHINVLSDFWNKCSDYWIEIYNNLNNGS